MDAENKIIFTIDSEESLPVEAFCDALVAFDSEYKAYSNNSKQLLIKEIRKGSFEVEFVDLIIIPSLVFASHANEVIEFLNHLKKIIQTLLSKADAPKDIRAKSIENIQNIASPIINGDHNTINIYHISAPDSGIRLDGKEAKTINKEAPKLIASIKKEKEVPEQTIFHKQLFNWYQTRFDDKKVSEGNRGIIEAIHKGDVKVIFEDDNSSTKKEMTTSYDLVDWQQRGYIVDVEVMRRDKKIVAYKILNNYMKDSIEPELFEN